MFSTAPSLLATTVLLVLDAVLTLGFAVIWFVFAATLVVSMLVAIHRSIPRAER
jgi:cytochrome oxidase assembly protein ShyY1